MKSCIRQFHREDSAQVLAIFALLAFVIIGLMGLATDIGRIYVARAELGRSVDAAALAGAKQLPDIVAADLKARAYITENEPGAIVNIEVYPDVPAQQVEVRATKTVSTVFLRALGRTTVQVKNQATAGFGTIPVDAYLAIDATNSMHRGAGTNANPDCNSTQTNSGCPIKEAKEGATNFVNTLLVDGGTATDTVVGTGAFRGCYDAPRSHVACIDISGAGNMITNLTYVKSTALAGIAGIYAINGPGQPTSGSGTNICQALVKGQSVLFGTGSHTASNTQRFAVILSDGDNVYNGPVVYQASPQSPLSPCMPTTTPANADGNVGPDCLDNTQTREAQVDTYSHNMANTLKGLGVEIYVIGLSVCGGIESTSTLCNTTGIGSTGASHPDSTADHRLLKCIASSSPGTNDHFFETATAADLPEIFQTIANNISFRLIK